MNRACAVLLLYNLCIYSLFLAKEDCSHCVVCLQGLAKRVGARLLLASTSEVYGGKKDASRSSKYCLNNQIELVKFMDFFWQDIQWMCSDIISEQKPNCLPHLALFVITFWCFIHRKSHQSHMDGCVRGKWWCAQGSAAHVTQSMGVFTWTEWPRFLCFCMWTWYPVFRNLDWFSVEKTESLSFKNVSEMFLKCLCSRSRGTPTKWGVLGACESNWSSSMLRWGETCSRDHVLCLHETGIITVTQQYAFEKITGLREVIFFLFDWRLC